MEVTADTKPGDLHHLTFITNDLAPARNTVRRQERRPSVIPSGAVVQTKRGILVRNPAPRSSTRSLVYNLRMGNANNGRSDLDYPARAALPTKLRSMKR
jgi:hypothetical protein